MLCLYLIALLLISTLIYEDTRLPSLDELLSPVAALFVQIIPEPPPPEFVAWGVVGGVVLWLIIMVWGRVVRSLVAVEGLLDALVIGIAYHFALVQQTTPFPVGFGKGGYAALHHAFALDRAKADVLLLLGLVVIIGIGIGFTLLPTNDAAVTPVPAE